MCGLRGTRKRNEGVEMYEVVVPFKSYLAGNPLELMNYFGNGTMDDVAQAYELAMLLGKDVAFAEMFLDDPDAWNPSHTYVIDDVEYFPNYLKVSAFTILAVLQRNGYTSTSDGLPFEVYVRDDKTNRVFPYLSSRRPTSRVVGFVARLFAQNKRRFAGEIIRFVELDLISLFMPVNPPADMAVPARQQDV